MIKKTLAVIFGGRSSEHEVSCRSAILVINNIDYEKYDLVLIGITKDGRWLKVDTKTKIEDDSWRNSTVTAVVSPDAGQKCILYLEGDNVKKQTLDVVFPVLHGLNGEDGTIQGLFELAGIPYVGCGVLTSAVAMDKLYTKRLVQELGIRQAKCIRIDRRELENCDWICHNVEEELGYPVFVKPSNSGSSCGVTKVHSREELEPALMLASKHDRKIMIEEAIVGRELECAVLGNTKIRASGVGEILPAAEFYDYDAKYNNEDSVTVISPDLPEGIAQEISSDAVRIFSTLDGFGLARVDFFLEDGTNEVVFNEINTMPGFTNISMYPMLWEAKGISLPVLVGNLIDMAFQR